MLKMSCVFDREVQLPFDRSNEFFRDHEWFMPSEKPSEEERECLLLLLRSETEPGEDPFYAIVRGFYLNGVYYGYLPNKVTEPNGEGDDLYDSLFPEAWTTDDHLWNK